MAKLNLKAGAKLDMAVRNGDGELNLKTSFVKESGGKLQLSMPMVGGKAFVPVDGAPIELTWGTDGTVYALSASAAGTVKAGIRTYLVVKAEDEVQRTERRAFARVPAEIDVEITSYDTAPDGARVSRVYPGRTSDISGGGVAVFTNASMAVGETVDIVVNEKGGKPLPLRAAVCWSRPAPKRTSFRFSTGLQFFFLNSGEAASVARLVASLAAKRA